MEGKQHPTQVASVSPVRIGGAVHSARKAFFTGTHRSRSPAETLADYRRFMPRMGITRLANVTGLDRIGLPVYIAVRPNARALSTSQGKGETMEVAKTSALMEAIESWHGERVAGPALVEAYRDLVADGGAVDPALLAVRADANFLPDRPMEWLQGWDLLRQRPVLVPYDAVSTNFVELPERRPILLKTTNGLASGNNLLEATVHGLLEVIERDALTLWSLRSPVEQETRRLHPASVQDPHLSALITLMADKGVAVIIEDLTTDLEIPVYSCTLVDDPRLPQWRGVPRASGHGAHLQDTIALSRAVHEAVQSRATLISGSRDDLFQRDYANATSRDDDLRWLERTANPPGWFGGRARPAFDWFEQDLAYLCERLVAAGIESAAAIDLSRGDVGIPVIKVVVPGLEPMRTAVYRPGPRARAMLQRGAA